MGRISLIAHLFSSDNPFPLTPALSLRERENRIPVHLERPQPRFADALAAIPPSLRERAGVRGKRPFIVIAVQKLSAPRVDEMD